MTLFIDFILVAGIVITTLILFALFKSQKDLPRKLLIGFFGLILLFFINVYSSVHELTIPYFITYVFNDIIELSVGPIIYIYIKSLFENTQSLFKKNWFHFIPAIVFAGLVTAPILYSMSQNELVFGYLEYLNDEKNWIFQGLIAYLLIYVIVSLRLFTVYRKAMKGQFSTFSESDFGWIARMLWGVLLISILDLSLGIYGMFYEAELLNDMVTLVSVIILIFFLGYYGVNQSKILLPDFLIPIKKNLVAQTQTTASPTLLSESEFNILNQCLTDVIEEKKPHLDEDLTLNKLATYVGTTDKKLSILLNQHLHTSFYDFVNKHRIELVKDKIESHQFENLTLLGIAFESGFKSKTSFNRIFKKETGVSPSEFKKRVKTVD